MHKSVRRGGGYPPPLLSRSGGFVCRCLANINLSVYICAHLCVCGCLRLHLGSHTPPKVRYVSWFSLICNIPFVTHITLTLSQFCSLNEPARPPKGSQNRVEDAQMTPRETQDLQDPSQDVPRPIQMLKKRFQDPFRTDFCSQIGVLGGVFLPGSLWGSFGCPRLYSETL